MPDTIQIIRA